MAIPHTAALLLEDHDFFQTWRGYALVGGMPAEQTQTWPPSRNPALPSQVGCAVRMLLRMYGLCLGTHYCWFFERPLQLRVCVEARRTRREEKRKKQVSVSLRLASCCEDRKAGSVDLFCLPLCFSQDMNSGERPLPEATSVGAPSREVLQEEAATGRQASFSVAPGYQRSKVHSAGPAVKLVWQTVVGAHERGAVEEDQHAAELAHHSAAELGKDASLVPLYFVILFKIIVQARHSCHLLVPDLL
jgi:hypothetical protein